MEGRASQGREPEGRDWLRAQLTAFNCASCGKPYEESRIRVLAQRDDLWFVSMKCEGCGSGALGLVTVREDDEASADGTGPGAATGESHQPTFRGELTDADLVRLADGAPVDSDDLIETHRFLTRFNGDFRALFRGGEGR